MKNFDIEKIRFLSIIAGMCFVLILVVWKAYDFLPAEEITKINNTINTTNYSKIQEQDNEEYAKNENIEQIKDALDNTKENENDTDIEPPVTLNEKKKLLKPLETIYEDITAPQIKPQTKQQEKVKEKEKDNSMDEMLAKADEFYNDGAFDMAISEYQDIIRITENDEIKALCNENIKKIYEKTNYKK